MTLHFWGFVTKPWGDETTHDISTSNTGLVHEKPPSPKTRFNKNERDQVGNLENVNDIV